MVQEAAKSASKPRCGPICDSSQSNTAKSATKRSDAVKNCVKLIGFVAVVVLVLQCGAQQLQASKLPARSQTTVRLEPSCCLDISENGTSNVLVDSIDRHDRGINDKPHSNGHSLPGESVGVVGVQLLQETNVTNSQLELPAQPLESTTIKSGEEVAPGSSSSGEPTNGDDKSADLSTGGSQNLATMASSEAVLSPTGLSDPRLSLDQLAMIHASLDSNSAELVSTVVHPMESPQLVAPSSPVVEAPVEQQSVSASMDQPLLAELTLQGTKAGLMAAQDLATAQANTNYDRQLDRGNPSEDNDNDDDSSLSPSSDFNEESAQIDPDKSDLDENSNNARQQRFSPMMQQGQPLERAPNVYQDNTLRHLDVGGSLAREQSNELAPEKARGSDETAMMNEQQMPDSIESLMRSGGETGAMDADDQSAVDEPENELEQGQQQLAAGNNYVQNTELPGAINQEALLAGGANVYQDPAGLPGVGLQNLPSASPVSSVDEGDDDQGSDDYDDSGENRAISSPSSLYNQQASLQDNRFPAQLSGSTGQQLQTDSTLNGPVMQDYMQTAAGHYYGKKKKKKVKKVKKVKVVKIKKKKKKKKKYKVIKYKKKKKKKKKKGKKHVDHGKYYMYAKVPKKKAWEFGFKKGNKKHWIERHEKGHKNKFKTKVKWYDKKSKGKGVHIWDYNHHDKKKKKHYG